MVSCHYVDMRTQIASTKQHQRKYHGSSTYSLVNRLKLPQPTVIIQKLTVIKTMIIGRVSLSVVGWCQYGHLVAVDTVVSEEKLDFLCNLKIMVITHTQKRKNK